MKIFKLPDLGEGLPDAEIHEWYIKEGDIVNLDQPLVSMETAKAVVDVPAPYAGKIAKLYGKPGDIIPTGAPLIGFEDESGEAKEEKRADSGTVVGSIEVSDRILQESPTGITPTSGEKGGFKATPAVRALAKKLNVNLEDIAPTGPNQTITLEDVTRASEGGSSKNATQEVKGEPLQSTRRMMAINMAKSHTEIVPVTLIEDADIYRWPEKTDITARILRAIVAACEAEPAMNAHFYTATLSRQLHKEINIGLAVDTANGLFVPVIKNVANLSDEELRNHINSFKEKAKNQNFAPQDLQNGTITLSNFGTITGRYANPIVVPPTVAIIGIGKTRMAVVPHDGKPAIHPIMPICLTFDHRAVTGGEAARFLATLIKHLESE